MLKKNIISLTLTLAMIVGIIGSISVADVSAATEVDEVSASVQETVSSEESYGTTLGAKDGEYTDNYSFDLSSRANNNIADYYKDSTSNPATESLTVGGYTYLYSVKSTQASDNDKFNLDARSKNSVGVYYYSTSSKDKLYAYGINTGTASYRRIYKTSNLDTYYNITVKKAPTSISFSRGGSSIPSEGFTIGVGESIDIDFAYSSGSYSNNLNMVRSTSIDVKIVKRTDTGGTFRITGNKVGSTVFTLRTYNNKSDSCRINIKEAPTSVSLNKSSITIGVGETFDLDSIVPSGSASRSTTFSSDNTAVCTVAAAGGLITGKKAGTATITAKTYNGKTATCKVTVKNAPNSVSLNKSSITIGIGETFSLVSSLPSGTASYNITYSSNKSSVCSVASAGGLITGKAEGTATITATTFNGKKATCTVTVKKAPRDGDVYLTCKDTNNCVVTDIKMLKGETFDLDYHMVDGYFSYYLVYSSDNKDICEVTEQGGYVTAKAKGTCNIIATTYNGEAAVCRITVVDELYDIADATTVQKVVAEYEEATDYYLYMFDLNNDGELSIIDATLIQRWVAGLE